MDIKVISNIIKKISSTALGPLGISPLLLRKTEGTMSQIIWRWCRTVLDTETLPSINILSIIYPLLKPGKSAGNPASYRPMALTELLVRVLEKILQKIMQKPTEKFGLFSEEQHRFRQKRSTVSNILKSSKESLKKESEAKQWTLSFWTCQKPSTRSQPKCLSRD